MALLAKRRSQRVPEIFTNPWLHWRGWGAEVSRAKGVLERLGAKVFSFVTG
jgi:hypothetical protein